MTNVEMYLVGGAVRDHYRRTKSKDWDFAVETNSFSSMRDWLGENGFEIFKESPKYFTIRARAEADEFRFGNLDLTGTTFDFTLCRTEKDYTDGRHPDTVEIGTIYDDLARRDFTMNAVAMDKTGNYLDPFNGRNAIRDMEIECVGSTERLQEDGLRIMRAIRFGVQLHFLISEDIQKFLKSKEAVNALSVISEDRIRDELNKALRISTPDTLWQLNRYPLIREHLFYNTGLSLEATSAKR